MTASENNKLAEELAKSLESATNLMQNLLGDIKDNASSLVLVKAKLDSLSSSVESLSHIVREGNGKGSMITRLALVEKSLEDIENNFDKFADDVHRSIKELRDAIDNEKLLRDQEQKTEKEFRREQVLAKLKMAGVIAPGVIALVILIIKMLTGDVSPPTP